MAKDFMKIINKFNGTLNSYFPENNIKSAWYRFYFFK